MDYENLLKEMEPNNAMRIPGNYYAAIYGHPSNTGSWAWKLSGHHLTLNFTMVDGKLAFAPFFFGANPAEVKQGSKKGNRLLKDEEDLAFELLHSMNESQQQKTIYSTTTFNDIITKNSVEVGPLETQGIMTAELSIAQKMTLNKLILTYLNSMPHELAEKRMAAILKEDFDTIYFGWAGATDRSKAHYYRIQGKSFLVEFDNSQNNANHIHTVWRDFNGDFGRDLLEEHLEHDHKH